MTQKKFIKRNILLGILSILLVVFVIKSLIPKYDLQKKISDLRETSKPMFDSTSQKINEENAFLFNINSLIEIRDFEIANKLIDTALKYRPNSSILHTYKGIILSGQGKYKEAINKYNTSISLARTELPITLSKRAEAYLLLNDYEKAISDYRKAAALNSDFNYQLANAFEKSNSIDSAIYYYSQFLSDYPEKNEVRDHLNYLTSLKK